VLRSIKSQIILALSMIIIALMGFTAYLLIEQKIQEVNHDIFNKALSFAELTHERIIDSFENNYQQQAFVNFERERGEVFSLNEDISGLSIYSYDGTALYQDNSLESAFLVDLDRIQAVIPSVKVRETGRIVYLEKSNGAWRYTSLNGQEVNPIRDDEQIESIVYPFRDPNDITRSYTLSYNVSYELLISRIQQTVLRISAIAVAGVVIALLIGFLLANGITNPLKILSKGVSKIGQGDLTTRIPIKSKSEIGKLAQTFNDMAVDLEKSTELKIEHERTAKELELATTIQQDLLPKDIPKVPGLDIACSLNPATEVGGDCYDLIPINDNTGLLFYIADVTGHGVGAGLVSAISNALIPALMKYFDNTKDLVIDLNRVLKLKTSPSIFVTLVMAMWDSKSHQLHFTQAGHHAILHYQAKAQAVKPLAYGGMALGMIDDLSKVVKTESATIEAGDVFVLYTDGIPEAWGDNHEAYGEERLQETLKKNAGLATAQEIHDALIKDLNDFTKDNVQEDDITLMVFKRS